MALHQLKYPYRDVIRPIVKHLTFINPNLISFLAVIVAFYTGYCIYFGAECPKMFIYAVILIFVRMTLNTMDGVIAIEREQDNKICGKVMNALPDRYSDLFVLAGIALSPLVNNFLGLLGLCTVVLVSYSGILGKALGVSWQGFGPLDKVERFFWLILAVIIQYIFCIKGQPTFSICSYTLSYLDILMIIFFILGQITVLRRYLGIKKEVTENPDMEW